MFVSHTRDSSFFFWVVWCDVESKVDGNSILKLEHDSIFFSTSTSKFNVGRAQVF